MGGNGSWLRLHAGLVCQLAWSRPHSGPPGLLLLLLTLPAWPGGCLPAPDSTGLGSLLTPRQGLALGYQAGFKYQHHSATPTAGPQAGCLFCLTSMCLLIKWDLTGAPYLTGDSGQLAHGAVNLGRLILLFHTDSGGAGVLAKQASGGQSRSLTFPLHRVRIMEMSGRRGRAKACACLRVQLSCSPAAGP